MPMNMPPDASALPSAELLADIEQVAVELARVAGAEIATALNRPFAVRYKSGAEGQMAPTDPVSEVDHNVEVFIRERLAEHFPDHDVIGEEIDLHPGSHQDFVWVVDPVDGTNNFINGFPLFAASIGVLYQGYPVAGAIWCSTSHELRPGVYHAHRGGALLFEGNRVEPKRRTQVKRRLAGGPGGSVRRTAWWDNRVTGSAAIECAFVAAGLLIGSRFRRLRIWDAGAGLTLIRAAGGEAWTQDRKKGWIPLERFLTPINPTEKHEVSLRDWNQPLIIGTAEAVKAMREMD